MCSRKAFRELFSSDYGSISERRDSLHKQKLQAWSRISPGGKLLRKVFGDDVDESTGRSHELSRAFLETNFVITHSLTVARALHGRIMLRWDWDTARMRFDLSRDCVVMRSSGKSQA
jgi:hypothetical protein